MHRRLLCYQMRRRIYYDLAVIMLAIDRLHLIIIKNGVAMLRYLQQPVPRNFDVIADYRFACRAVCPSVALCTRQHDGTIDQP